MSLAVRTRMRILLALSLAMTVLGGIALAHMWSQLQSRDSLPPLGNNPQGELTDLGPVPDFSFSERGGQTVTNQDLHGKVWVASFIFTCCTESCPRISGTMARLQKELAGNENLVLVSFSVNPQMDTPERLKTYAAAYGADARRWLFLTGDQPKMYDLVKNGFHLAVEQTQGAERRPGNEVLHSSKLVLVDKQGKIRGYFDGTSEEGLKELKAKITQVVRE